MKKLLVTLIGLLPLATFAQDPARGEGGYPQFRNISGLPGGGFGLRPDGTIGIDGALSLTTPIAYSLTKKQFVVVAGGMSFDMTPRFDFGGGDDRADFNGTAAILGGWGTEGVDFTVGGLLLSGIGDSVLNLHVSPTTEYGGLRFGLGIQDVFDTGGEFGERPDLERGGGDSRSIYGVVTKALPEARAYLSAGIGSNRFSKGFANASVGFSDAARGYLEYDGKWIGFGGAYGIGNFTLLAGVTNGKYLVYSAAYRF